MRRKNFWRMIHTPPKRHSETPSVWGNNLCTLAPTEADAHLSRQPAEAHGLEIPSLGTYLTVGDMAAAEESMRFAQIAGAP